MWFEARKSSTSLAAAVCALILLSTGCVQHETSLEEDSSSHSWPGEEWQTSSLEAEGIAVLPITRFVEEIKSGKYGMVDHFLLIRNGRVVVDERFTRNYEAVAAKVRPEERIGLNRRDPKYDYENVDYHPYYKGSELHTLQSVSKSVTSLALGIAIDNGYIKGVSAPVLPFFAAYEFDRSDPRRAAMTVEDLLTMRSGIEWEPDGSFQDPKTSTVSLENAEEWVQFILDHPMDTEPGTSFEYNDGASVLLGKIIGTATGQRLDKWTEERLFDPIGIENYYWKATPDGEIDSMGGLYLSAHDLARIGLLVLHQGMWAGDRVVSENWIRQSTSPHVVDTAPNDDDDNRVYGYQWWLPNSNTARPRAIAATGFGGQRLTVIPELDLIIVFTGYDLRGEYWAAEQALRTGILPDAVRR
ncbi:serine hydrolase [Rheinheimera salexigens]|uniref:Serine hydrolase n=1 Tax=Rheinheimera salexigens TaxID=1628148 RepID=A0A1E7QAH8_9GAMM|nr:serine hydrolase [Rheinheimera salexigens]